MSAIVDENRRLFYVAITRAKEQLFILTEANRESPFVDEIRRGTSTSTVNWKKFPPVPGGDACIVVSVNGPYEAIRQIKDTLKADGYQYRDLSMQGGERVWEKAFVRRDFAFEGLNESPWGQEIKSKLLDGIRVEVRDDRESHVSTAISLAWVLREQPGRRNPV